MYEVMLMRHAKSDWQYDVADIDRPLNPRGRRNALAMGRYLAEIDCVPSRIILSSSQRTRETAELLLQSLPLKKDALQIDRELYLADRETLLEAMELYANEGQRLLILAHNPGMDDTVNYLASSPPPLSASGKLMTTCAVACFTFASLADLNRPARCECRQLLRPADIPAQDSADQNGDDQDGGVQNRAD